MLRWYEIEPRAVPVTADSVNFTVAVEGVPNGVQLNTGRFIPLAQVQNGLYSARVAVSDLLFNYRTGDLHNTSAFLEIITSTLTQQVPVTVNVRDGTVPLVSVQQLAPNVQATSHVANLRYDSIYYGGLVPPAVLRTFYQFFPDEYDFINVLAQVQARFNYHYLAVRNNVIGLGLQTFERVEDYGSADRLQGVLHFPDDAQFDPAETSVLHELAHRWMAFSNLQSLRGSRPHFPISTLARGITGYPDTDPITERPNVFRWELTPLADGTYAVSRLADRPRAFNDFELYLMGLLPPDSVQPHIVFLNQDQRSQLRSGGILSGPTDTVTVAEWVARDGVRTPTYLTAQRGFRMATIVLSRGRLLTQEEMAFYHAMAVRGESDAALPAILETTRFTTLPFGLATGGRAQLITRLRIITGS